MSPNGYVFLLVRIGIKKVVPCSSFNSLLVNKCKLMTYGCHNINRLHDCFHYYKSNCKMTRWMFAIQFTFNFLFEFSLPFQYFPYNYPSFWASNVFWRKKLNSSTKHDFFFEANLLPLLGYKGSSSPPQRNHETNKGPTRGRINPL
mgnify:CR=1 FL=1